MRPPKGVPLIVVPALGLAYRNVLVVGFLVAWFCEHGQLKLAWYVVFAQRGWR